MSAEHFKKYITLMESKEDIALRVVRPKVVDKLIKLSRRTSWSTREEKFAKLYLNRVLVFVTDKDIPKYAYDTKTHELVDTKNTDITKESYPELYVSLKRLIDNFLGK